MWLRWKGAERFQRLREASMRMSWIDFHEEQVDCVLELAMSAPRT